LAQSENLPQDFCHGSPKAEHQLDEGVLTPTCFKNQITPPSTTPFANLPTRFSLIDQIDRDLRFEGIPHKMRPDLRLTRMGPIVRRG